EEFLAFAGEWVRRAFRSRVDEAGLSPVELDCDDLSVFRGLFGRRTEAEVCALGWSSDPAPYLDVFFVFGRAPESLGERV
ncbi:MAG TPA: hypothetical protein VL916_06240, partial [Ilumatobacteraceae bacterium]|nr:hypothetical protein [Ilumatobacteraceae bacterium]